ncbi:tetratricopeptide repeat protein [Carboxydochorda subterranea]|uniref:Tetratricopeptide repeat protein n=1 Tax=Carboxydichorda subterranea TaxID=3109565 RepID=A0ABZ1C195_9FIRM|nr:tetratricopeptide repeat protein [Limnochorda sp. L945t]WRP18797.1 tetratricopeptide repeat protein [Limnochorda sp. L945t]
MGRGAGGLAVKAERMVDEGRAALERGDMQRALACFERATAISPIPAALNNLALVVLEHRKDPAEALKILQPNLEPAPQPQSDSAVPQQGAGHPFAHAIAARCCHELGERQAARRHLDAAVRAFERGPAATFPGPRRTWLEYTAVILHAAGTLGDDRGAWDLYRRWSAHHVLPQSHYFGGIAAFNLRRFEAACRAWRQSHERRWEFVEAFAEVAQLCEAGLVPPFRLPYETPETEHLAAELEKARGDDDGVAEIAQRVTRDPLHRMLLLSSTLGSGASGWNRVVRETWAGGGREADRESGVARPEESGAALTALVAYTGEWGEQLARSIFLSNRTTMRQKMDAAQGLVRAGVLALGEKVRVLVDGRVQYVTFREKPVVMGHDPELDEKHREALALRDAGRVEEAKKILEGLLLEGERVWPPAAVTYANLLRKEGKLREARVYLEMARKLMPDDPAVLFNLAALSLQEGDFNQATELVARIKTDDPAILDAVGRLNRQLHELGRRE